MKTAFFAFVTGVALIAPEGALAHGRHRHRHHQGHLHFQPPSVARRDCHYHHKKGTWHCHTRLRGHGQNRPPHPHGVGVHFFVPF